MNRRPVARGPDGARPRVRGVAPTIAVAGVAMLGSAAFAQAAPPPGLGYVSAFDGYVGYVAAGTDLGWRAANERVAPPGARPADEAAPRERAAPAPRDPAAGAKPAAPDHSHHGGHRE